MKKSAIIIALILCISMIYTQEDAYELSPWSFTAEYGVSNLDGDGDATIHPALGV